MNRSHHPDMPEHPRTFDEVIARGFPHEQLEALQRAHQERVRARRVVAVPSAPVVARAATATTRKDAGTQFTPDEQAAFKNAVVRLVQEGTYLQLVQSTWT